MAYAEKGISCSKRFTPSPGLAGATGAMAGATGRGSWGSRPPRCGGATHLTPGSSVVSLVGASGGGGAAGVGLFPGLVALEGSTGIGTHATSDQRDGQPQAWEQGWQLIERNCRAGGEALPPDLPSPADRPPLPYSTSSMASLIIMEPCCRVQQLPVVCRIKCPCRRQDLRRGGRGERGGGGEGHDDEECGCVSSCPLQVIRAGLWVASLEVIETTQGCGHGLRTREAIKAGDIICEYVGELLRSVEAKERMARYSRRPADGPADRPIGRSTGCPVNTWTVSLSHACLSMPCESTTLHTLHTLHALHALHTLHIIHTLYILYILYTLYTRYTRIALRILLPPAGMTRTPST